MFATFLVVVAVIALIRGHLNWARIGSRKAAGIACGIGVALFLLAGAIQSEPQTSAISNNAPATSAAAGDTSTTAAATTTVAPSTSSPSPTTTTTTITATTNPTPTPTPETSRTEQTSAPNPNPDQAFLDAIHNDGISGHSDHQLTNWGATSCVYMSVNGASAIETSRELAKTFSLTQHEGYLVVTEAIKYMCPDQKSKLPK